jgi:hypothetical protein
MNKEATYQITFQMVSLYDSSLEKFVTRISNHLRDSLSIIYEFSDLKIDTDRSILLGDIEPPSKYYSDLELHYLVFNLFDYLNVEEIIKEINKAIYGENLVTIPNPNKSYIIKIISDFSN